jgi:hypothetical protein
MYTKYIGEIPEDFFVTKMCEKNRCMNPSHLKLIHKIDFHSTHSTGSHRKRLTEQVLTRIFEMKDLGYSIKEIVFSYNERCEENFVGLDLKFHKKFKKDKKCLNPNIF